MTPAKLEQAEEMAAQGASRAEIARKLGVSRSTVSRHLSGKVG
jgi:DNA-binding CsgD family transcriptional regulator